MNRRDFLKLAGSVIVAFGLPGITKASAMTYKTSTQAQLWTKIGNKAGAIPAGVIVETGRSIYIRGRDMVELTTTQYARKFIEPRYLGQYSPIEQGQTIAATPETFDTVIAQAQPGDTVVLGAGVYTTSRTWSIPLTVQAAAGARAALAGLQILTAGMTFQDIEFFDPNCDRATSGEIMQVKSSGTKLIRCILHDATGGMSVSGSAQNCEFIDCIFYSIGSNDGRAHTIYPQNEQGVKLFKNCIVFGGSGYNIHAYSTLPKLNGLHFIDMISFQAGEYRNVTYYSYNLHVGGETYRGNDLLIQNCLSYYDTARQWGGIRVGYNAGMDNVRIIDNIVLPVQNGEVMTLKKTTPNEMTGNVFCGYVSSDGAGVQPASYPDNEWLSTAYPDLVQVNQCSSKPGRAHVAIVNGSTAESVSICLCDGFQFRDVIEIRNVTDYYGDVITTKVGRNGRVNIDMRAASHTRAQSIGWQTAASTFPRFGTFVIEKKG